MLFIDETTSHVDLQCAILNDKGLYAMFNEARFLNDGYTTDELRQVVVAWIEAGDECFKM